MITALPQGLQGTPPPEGVDVPALPMTADDPCPICPTGKHWWFRLTSGAIVCLPCLLPWPADRPPLPPARQPSPEARERSLPGVVLEGEPVCRVIPLPAPAPCRCGGTWLRGPQDWRCSRCDTTRAFPEPMPSAVDAATEAGGA